MKIIGKAASDLEVSKALVKAIEWINQELKGADGLITKIDCEITTGFSGASVSIAAIVNGNEPRRKEIVGVNVRGVSREHSVRKAVEGINQVLNGKNGEIADMFIKTIDTPLPGRVYTTIIAAINERAIEDVKDAAARRRRIKKTLELLNNNPSALNLAMVAEIFGVSRSMIYKDLEVLGYKRTERQE